ncbi:MAG: hypothetical protein ACRECH_08465 [Nitrososphaerales archaeon]
MAHSYSTAALIGVLVIGLVVGAAGVYVGTHASPTTMTITQTTMITTTSTLTSSTAAGNTPTMSQFLGALKNSSSVNVTVKSFDFGKGTLGVWIVNNGTGPIVLSPADVIYNKTTTGPVISFSYVDPAVTQVGVYAYIPVGSQLFISVIPFSPPGAGQKATLQIVNDMFTFTYGTSG